MKCRRSFLNWSLFSSVSSVVKRISCFLHRVFLITRFDSRLAAASFHFPLFVYGLRLETLACAVAQVYDVVAGASVQLTRARVPPESSAVPIISRGGRAATTFVVAVRLKPSGPRTRTVPPSGAPPSEDSSVSTSTNGSATRQWLPRCERNSKTRSGGLWMRAVASMSAAGSASPEATVPGYLCAERGLED